MLNVWISCAANIGNNDTTLRQSLQAYQLICNSALICFLSDVQVYLSFHANPQRLFLETLMSLSQFALPADESVYWLCG